MGGVGCGELRALVCVGKGVGLRCGLVGGVKLMSRIMTFAAGRCWVPWDFVAFRFLWRWRVDIIYRIFRFGLEVLFYGFSGVPE